MRAVKGRKIADVAIGVTTITVAVAAVDVVVAAVVAVDVVVVAVVAVDAVTTAEKDGGFSC